MSNVLVHRAPDQHALQLLIAITTVSVVVAAYLSPLAVGVLLAMVVLVLAALGFRLLLWALIFFLPIAPYLAWDLPVKDLATLFRFALFAGTLVYTVRRGKTVRHVLFSGGLTWTVLAYFAVAVLSAVVFNPATGAAARELMRLSSYVCFYYTITTLLETDRDFGEAFSALMVSSICVALFGFYQFVVGDYSALYQALYPFQDDAQKAPEWSGRITSFLGHFNSLAGYLNLQIPLFMALALRAGEKRVRRLANISLGLSAVTLVLTQSRGALIALAAILLFAAFVLAPPSRGRVRWFSYSAVAITLAALGLGAVFQRLSGIDDYTEITRLAVWAGATTVFAGAPVVGIGFGNLRTVLAGFIDLPNDFIVDAHNLYLELLAETGVVGLLLFLVLIFVALRLAWQLMRGRRDAIASLIGFAGFAAILGVVVHGGVDYMFHTSPQFSAMFFLVLGMLNAASKKIESHHGDHGDT